MPVENVNAAQLAGRCMSLLHSIAETAIPQVTSAARLVADCVAADGVVQAFGTGHSQAVALEIAGRAGGFIPTNRLSLADLALFGGERPDVLGDPLLERRSGIAEKLYALAAPHAADLFVIVSNSGVNNAVVEMALTAKDHGHRIVAITSLAHTRAVPAAHASGRKLADIADVVLDNAAPPGDALLRLPDGGSVCAASTLTATLLVQMTVAEATALLLAEGHMPPVYVSANVPGGYERNLRLQDHYGTRIRRAAG